MDFFAILQRMLVILFAIVAGFVCRKLNFLGGETDQKISKLILNLTMPCMILAAVINGDTLPEASVVLGIFKVSAVFYGLEFLFAFLLPRFLPGTPGQKGVWRFGLAFPNVGFIGYPVAVALFGQEALFYAVLLVMPFNLLSFTMGPLLLTGVKQFSLRKMFSPTVIASLLSLVMALARIRPPAFTGELLAFLGDITVPLSLLFTGSILAGLRHMTPSPKLILLSAVRLLVLPAALCPILRVMGTDSLILGIAVTQMAMPVAVNGSLLCMEHGGDAESMAQLTLISTAASMITIPLIAAALL